MVLQHVDTYFTMNKEKPAATKEQLEAQENKFTAGNLRPLLKSQNNTTGYEYEKEDIHNFTVDLLDHFSKKKWSDVNIRCLKQFYDGTHFQDVGPGHGIALLALEQLEKQEEEKQEEEKQEEEKIMYRYNRDTSKFIKVQEDIPKDKIFIVVVECGSSGIKFVPLYAKDNHNNGVKSISSQKVEKLLLVDGNTYKKRSRIEGNPSIDNKKEEFDKYFENAGTFVIHAFVSQGHLNAGYGVEADNRDIKDKYTKMFGRRFLNEDDFKFSDFHIGGKAEAEAEKRSLENRIGDLKADDVCVSVGGETTQMMIKGGKADSKSTEQWNAGEIGKFFEEASTPGNIVLFGSLGFLVHGAVKHKDVNIRANSSSETPTEEQTQEPTPNKEQTQEPTPISVPTQKQSPSETASSETNDTKEPTPTEEQTPSVSTLTDYWEKQIKKITGGRRTRRGRRRTRRGRKRVTRRGRGGRIRRTRTKRGIGRRRRTRR